MLENYSRHQQGIIKRYYQNLDAIQLQKLSELVTELYLAEGKKAERLWKNVGAIMEKIGVPMPRVTLLLEKKDPALLASLVNELNAKM